MAWKVVKIPLPNEKLIIVRAPGHVLDVIHFQAQIMKESMLLNAQGQGKANLILAVWLLIDDEGQQEDHQFIMVQTGDEIPQVGAQIHHINTTLVLLPTGDHLEFNLFYAGETMQFSGMDLPDRNQQLNG